MEQPVPDRDEEAARLLEDISGLRSRIAAAAEERMQQWQAHIIQESFLPCAHNLACYLSFRQHELRDLQMRTIPFGLSALDHCESHVLATLDAIITTLKRICGETDAAYPDIGRFSHGQQQLADYAMSLFGPASPDHDTRIMVTLPSEAAESYELIHDLVSRGMSVARINCAHDNRKAWKKMAKYVRRAADEVGRPCMVMMDLAGPKCRTGMLVREPKHGRVVVGDFIHMIRPGGTSEVEAECTVECAVPEVLDQLADDAEVWIDDGKVATTVIGRDKEGVLLRVTKAPGKGAKIKAEKGLNFPGTHVQLNPLTDKDLDDLESAIELSDIIGYSFIKDGSNIDQLFGELERRTDRQLMLIAKIETQEAILNLPEIIVRAGGRTPFGIMIARGDLAVEIGYQRLSEMQEEILWVCEAASIPVVWATQVLEHAVKDGLPSRAEVTDAAMSGQAECVMLNKGAYITDAIEFLNNVLSRMQGHHTKKWNRMRALKSWH